MRVIVCGGRNFNDVQFVLTKLDEFHANHPITELIEGGATGVDAYASAWCAHKNIKHERVNAEWHIYKKSAGAIRNKAMLAMQPDMVIAFPGGPGTAHMKKIAYAEDIPVVEMNPEPKEIEK